MLLAEVLGDSGGRVVLSDGELLLLTVSNVDGNNKKLSLASFEMSRGLPPFVRVELVVGVSCVVRAARLLRGVPIR